MEYKKKGRHPENIKKTVESPILLEASTVNIDIRKYLLLSDVLHDQSFVLIHPLHAHHHRNKSLLFLLAYI